MIKIDFDKLEILLASKGMLWTELSNVSGVGRMTISKLKNQKHNPRPSTIGKLARALNVKVEDILKKES